MQATPQAGLQDLLTRASNATHKANLETAYSNDPMLFELDFFAAIQRLYKASTITASNFQDLATVLSSRTFSNYSVKQSRDEELQYDALFTAYFTSLGSKFAVPPRSLKNKILSLVKLKIQVNETNSIQLCGSAKINFRPVDESRRLPVNNSFDLVSQYSAARTLAAGEPTTVNLTTQATQITLDGPLASTLVTALIQYDQLNQDLALALNKEIKPFIKAVPLTTTSSLRGTRTYDSSTTDDDDDVR